MLQYVHQARHVPVQDRFVVGAPPRLVALGLHNVRRACVLCSVRAFARRVDGEICMRSIEFKLV